MALSMMLHSRMNAQDMLRKFFAKSLGFDFKAVSHVTVDRMDLSASVLLPDQLLKKVSCSLSKNDLSFDTAVVLHTHAKWTKANHIHRWFIMNSSEDVSSKQECMVQPCDIVKLLKLCKSVLRDPSSGHNLLPTMAGNGKFYGSVEYDSVYMEKTENTVKQLEALTQVQGWDEGVEYIYKYSH
jgi:hypothetical protein